MVPEDALGKGEEAPTPADLAFLRRAFVLARAAKAAGNHPFGAVVVDESGRAVAEAAQQLASPRGGPHPARRGGLPPHAPRACFGPRSLRPATLYTARSRAACAPGAIYWCNIRRVVYALSERRLLALTGGHPENPTLSLSAAAGCSRADSALSRVIGPLLEDEAAEVHLGFWG
jgi:tRNA(Arg) A34 adenosine deaminase TadA